VRASWNGHLLAQSDDIVVVEGNAYFPAASLDPAVIRPSQHTSVCPWKGTAHYYTLEVDGKRNEDAAWYYPTRSRPPHRSRVGSRSGKVSRSRRKPPFAVPPVPAFR
jgi:uncharacterized protein (DUF427 family)